MYLYNVITLLCNVLDANQMTINSLFDVYVFNAVLNMLIEHNDCDYGR